MAPQGRSAIISAITDITPQPQVNLGKNFRVANNSTEGVNIGSLQLQTKSILSSNGININRNGNYSSLTIDVNGNVQTDGTIYAVDSITTTSSLNSSSINVGGTNFTVADTGDLTTSGFISADGNLSIGSNFYVTSSNGSVTTGAVTSTGTISIGGTTNSPNIILGNDGNVEVVGHISADGNVFADGTLSSTGNFAVNTNKFTVAAASGNVYTAGTLSTIGNLSVNTNKFTVTAANGNVNTEGSISASGNMSAVGNLSATGNLAINTNKFTVTAANGNVYTAGTLSATGNLAINTDKFTVDALLGAVQFKGDLTINTDKFTVSAVDGKTTSSISYNSYTPAASSTNTTTTTVSGEIPDTTSATSNYLTTQEYVDKQIWQQTVRINTILGIDSQIIDNFNNVYKLITAIEGSSDTVTALNGINSNYNNLVDKQEEVKTSISTVVAQALNVVLVNCTPTVWADECGPMPIPNALTSKTIEDGWYFSNLSAGNKINWYMPTNANMTVGDIQNMYLNLFAASDMSLPFITIYTEPKGTNDYWNNFVHAKINYVFSVDSPSLTANKSYCLYTGAKPMNVYNKTCVGSPIVQTANATNKNNGIQGTNGSSVDTNIVSLTDKVVYITIQTTAGETVGNVNTVINSLNLCLKTGTTQFTFSNAGVVSNYLFNYLFTKNTDFSAFPAPLKQGAFVETYNSTFNSN